MEAFMILLLLLEAWLGVLLSGLWLRFRNLRDVGRRLAAIRAKYTKKHHGDTFRLEPFVRPLSIGG